MLLVCPECKNEVDISSYPNLDIDHIVECDVCGITLQVKSISDGKIDAEVVDEGK
jgi:ribosomal protein S27E